MDRASRLSGGTSVCGDKAMKTDGKPFYGQELPPLLISRGVVDIKDKHGNVVGRRLLIDRRPRLPHGITLGMVPSEDE